MEKNLGQIVNITKGKRHSLAEDVSKHSSRYLQIEDLRNDNNLKYTNDKKGVDVDESDILIAWDGANAGLIGYGLKGKLGSTLARLRLKKNDSVNSIFLGKLLQSQFAYLRRTSTGATIPHINRKALEKIQIPKIGLGHQKRIAQVLTDCEELIAKRKESIELLDELLKSTFLEMFGDPVQNSKKLATKKLVEIAKISRGKFTPRPRNDPKYFDGENPFVQTGDINRADDYLVEYTQTLNELGISVSKEFKKGTVLMALVGATIGETAILGIDAYTTDSVVGISPKSKKINPRYLEMVLRFWKPVLKSRAPEAARANINNETLKPIPIPIPSEVDLKKFSNAATSITDLKILYHNHLNELENLYARLSQDAFKGELDLSKVVLNKSYSVVEKTERHIELGAIGEKQTQYNPSSGDLKIEITNILVDNFQDEVFSVEDVFNEMKKKQSSITPSLIRSSFKKYIKENLIEQVFDEDLKQILFKLKK